MNRKLLRKFVLAGAVAAVPTFVWAQSTGSTGTTNENGTSQTQPGTPQTSPGLQPVTPVTPTTPETTTPTPGTGGSGFGFDAGYINPSPGTSPNEPGQTGTQP